MARDLPGPPVSSSPDGRPDVEGQGADLAGAGQPPGAVDAPPSVAAAAGPQPAPKPGKPGDCRFNMGRSLLVMAALMGSDVRLSGPAELHPPKDVVDLAKDVAGRTGARITVTEDPREAVSGVDFIHTDVWVSMGEAKDVWADRVKLLTPYQVNSALLKASGNPAVKFMHCLPAFHDPNTTVGREIMEHTGMTDGLEVTGEVFNSGASIVFDQAENRLHTIKAILVATLG